MVALNRSWRAFACTGEGFGKYAALLILALLLLPCAKARAENGLIRQKTDFALSDNEKEFIQSLAPLRVMVDENYAPLSFYDQSMKSYSGISVDLLVYIARGIGLKCQFIREPNLAWADKFERFKKKEIDVLLSASITRQRKEVGIFTSSYYDTYYGCIVQRHRKIKIRQPSDLSAYKVGSVKKTSILSYLEPLVNQKNMIYYDKPEELYRAIRRGDIDIGLRNTNVFFEERVNYEFFDLSLSYTITEFPTRYAFYLTNTPENIRLAEIMDRYLACLDYGGLIAKYERGEDELIIRYLDKKKEMQFLAAGGFGALILLSLLLFAYLNHRRISAKLAASLAQIQKHQKELEGSEWLLRTIIETVPECVQVLALDGALVSMNPAGLEMFEAESEARLVGVPLTNMIVKEYQAAYTTLGEKAAQGESGYLEFEALGLKGGRRRLATHALPLRGPDGHITGLLGVTRDITEIRRLERIKEDVERIVRHDLRTPLGGIISLPLLIKGDNLTPEQRELLDLVAVTGRKILNQINMSLEIYMIETGTYRFAPIPCDPLQIVRENAEILSLSMGRDLSLIQIRTELPTGVEGLTFPTDPLLLDIVVMNLLSNAVEASRKDEAVSVRISLDEDGRELVLAFSNSQPVPLKVRESFFEKYATAGKVGGTGLGTYSAAIMARAMGGEVDLATGEEIGTTVTVRLPLVCGLSPEREGACG